MSSLTSGPNLSAAFIDLATYGELEKRLYGNYPKSADNFLTYERIRTPKERFCFNLGPWPSTCFGKQYRIFLFILLLFIIFKFF